MTEQELAAIEAREQAATAGPWEDRWLKVADEAQELGEQVAVAVKGWESGQADGIVVGALWYDGLNTAITQADCAFVANARQDVPALVAEVRRLQSAIGWLRHAQALWIQERKDLNAEIDRLRGLIKQAEWADTSDMEAYCPWCGGREGARPGDGHEVTCPAFAAD